jgi:hypothetical protein
MYLKFQVNLNEEIDEGKQLLNVCKNSLFIVNFHKLNCQH